jgi:hypothetical protein
MPRGGARANSGPAPDPQSLRSMKAAAKSGVRVLPRERTEPAPEWPLMNPTVREQELWEKYWRKPQAVLWAEQDSDIEVAIHVRTLVEAEYPGVQSQRRTLLLQQMNSLLLTGATLAKANCRVATEDDESAAPAATGTAGKPAARRPSSRARLRAVPNAVESDPT